MSLRLTWIKTETPIFCLRHISPTGSDAADGSLLAVGFRGTILRSDDAGSSWHALPSDSTRGLESVAFNRLPNLAVTNASLDETCKPVITLTNRGEGPVPHSAWASAAAALTVTVDNHEPATATLTALDSDKLLRQRLEPVTYRLAAPVPEGRVGVSVVLNGEAAVLETTSSDNRMEVELHCNTASGQ